MLLKPSSCENTELNNWIVLNMDGPLRTNQVRFVHLMNKETNAGALRAMPLKPTGGALNRMERGLIGLRAGLVFRATLLPSTAIQGMNSLHRLASIQGSSMRRNIEFLSGVKMVTSMCGSVVFLIVGWAKRTTASPTKRMHEEPHYKTNFESYGTVEPSFACLYLQRPNGQTQKENKT